MIELVPLCSPIPASAALNCRVPGSKSYTIRALLIAALTPGVVQIENPLESDDTLAMKHCLNVLGIPVAQVDNAWFVEGSVHQVEPNRQYELNANLSAASLRFLTALSTILPGEQVLFGEHGLNQRPVKDLVDSLRRVGAYIIDHDREGYPPLRVLSDHLTPEDNVIRVSGKTSSQYASALMMIAPELVSRSGLDIVIELIDEPISRPYLEMTRSIMAAFGVTVEAPNDRQYRIRQGQHYQPITYAVETDASSMAYPLAIAALSQSTLTIENVKPDSVQADMELIEILKQMGNMMTFADGTLTIQGKGVQPLDYNMENCPDQAQTVAVLAAFAKGASRLSGLQSLRVKETDRLAAVTSELRKMGITVDETSDALTVYGGNPQAAQIATYGDHRMAMAFAVAGSVLPGVKIEHPEVSAKTYPGFWDDLKKLGIGVVPY
ncbi:MAG: 3-phosphoshikimate 1-carboxyvinyltransferase [Vampirovibrionales bacterium]|nr:3-phosphoshikimate 1-carboxyvinyltransferase [Vampirovibrionales bacterium]